MTQFFKTLQRRTCAEHLPVLSEIEEFGGSGEEIVYRMLSESFDCVIRNVVVPHKKLYLEKDFLVIYKGVPFVIEVKNWKGEIGCDEKGFYQKKDNGTHKTLKSPVGTTNQFIDRMREFYDIGGRVFGMVVFCERDCRIHLPNEMEEVALLPIQDMIPYIKTHAKREHQTHLDPDKILRCTRFYSRESEFCKGILADCFFDCTNDAGETLRVDTTALKYMSVEHQPLTLRDKLILTFVNGATGVFYNRDTILTVGCLDGSYRKIALHRVRHIVF